MKALLKDIREEGLFIAIKTWWRMRRLIRAIEKMERAGLGPDGKPLGVIIKVDVMTQITTWAQVQKLADLGVVILHKQTREVGGVQREYVDGVSMFGHPKKKINPRSMIKLEQGIRGSSIIEIINRQWEHLSAHEKIAWIVAANGREGGA